jgi:hypothetical protein
MSDKPPRCKVHGFVMCENFDYTRINNRAELATPNGTYTCYFCVRDTARASKKRKLAADGPITVERALTARRPCEVSGPTCTAPAGYVTGGGYTEGSRSCRATCLSCGRPVCGQCSKVRQRDGDRVRICDECAEDNSR